METLEPPDGVRRTLGQSEPFTAPTVLLAVRALLWTILMPGVLALYVPWRYFGLRDADVDVAAAADLAALAGIASGCSLLAACILEFLRSGRGTLSPAEPPKHLVVRGPYRFVRNPMYLGVSLVLLGEALLMASRPLLLYWIAWFSAVNLFVLGYEEPALHRRFGASYDEYRRQVGRWIPRFRPPDAAPPRAVVRPPGSSAR